MEPKRSSENAACCRGPVYPTVFNRRSFIQVGVLGGLGFGLADLFQLTGHAREVRPATGAFNPNEGTAKSAIQIILPGGLAHQESWDPKPEAPIEYRGPFGVAKTGFLGLSSVRISRAPQKSPARSQLSVRSRGVYRITSKRHTSC